MHKYLGITIIFSLHEIDKIWGVMKSYVIDFVESVEKLYKKIEEIVEEETFIQDGKVEYLGVYDIFTVSSNIENGAIVGYNIYDKLNSRNAALSLVSNQSEYSFQKQNINLANGYYLVEVVYLITDSKLKEKYVLNCKTVINAKSPIEVQSKLDVLPDQNEFIHKILSNDLKEIPSEIDLIGIKDISIINTLGTHWAFDVMYKEIEQQQEIKAITSSPEEILRLLKQCIPPIQTD